MVAAGRAGSRLQGRHGNLPAVPHTCAEPPPTSHGTSSQAHLLAISLISIIVIIIIIYNNGETVPYHKTSFGIGCVRHSESLGCEASND